MSKPMRKSVSPKFNKRSYKLALIALSADVGQADNGVIL